MRYRIGRDIGGTFTARALRIEVAERIDKDGKPRLAPDLAQLEPALRWALAAAPVQSVAVCLLHSYANPSHEQAIGAWLAASFPALGVSLSSEVFPLMR